MVLNLAWRPARLIQRAHRILVRGSLRLLFRSITRFERPRILHSRQLALRNVDDKLATACIYRPRKRGAVYGGIQKHNFVSRQQRDPFVDHQPAGRRRRECNYAKCGRSSQEPRRRHARRWIRVLGPLEPVFLRHESVIVQLLQKNTTRTVSYTQLPAYLSHAPVSRRPSIIGAMISPSAVGPMSSRLPESQADASPATQTHKFPFFDTISTNVCTIVDAFLYWLAFVALFSP